MPGSSIIPPPCTWHCLSMTTSANLIKATIKAVWQETPSVKGLQLRLVSRGSFRSLQLASSW